MRTQDVAMIRSCGIPTASVATTSAQMPSEATVVSKMSSVCVICGCGVTPKRTYTSCSQFWRSPPMRCDRSVAGNFTPLELDPQLHARKTTLKVLRQIGTSINGPFRQKDRLQTQSGRKTVLTRKRRYKSAKLAIISPYICKNIELF